MFYTMFVFTTFADTAFHGQSAMTHFRPSPSNYGSPYREFTCRCGQEVGLCSGYVGGNVGGPLMRPAALLIDIDARSGGVVLWCLDLYDPPPKARRGARANFLFVSSASAHGSRVWPREKEGGGAWWRSVPYNLAGPRRRLGFNPEYFRTGRLQYQHFLHLLLLTMYLLIGDINIAYCFYDTFYI